jgi:hypothetical protein
VDVRQCVVWGLVKEEVFSDTLLNFGETMGCAEQVDVSLG